MSAATPAGGNFGVGTWIERRARITPAHLALVGDGRSLTYADLAGRIRRLANALLNLDVGPGDRVAWLGPNHPAFLESLFACGQVRAALAPANHRLTPAQIRGVLDDTDPSVVIHHGTTESTSLPRSVRAPA